MDNHDKFTYPHRRLKAFGKATPSTESERNFSKEHVESVNNFKSSAEQSPNNQLADIKKELKKADDLLCQLEQDDRVASIASTAGHGRPEAHPACSVTSQESRPTHLADKTGLGLDSGSQTIGAIKKEENLTNRFPSTTAEEYSPKQGINHRDKLENRPEGTPLNITESYEEAPPEEAPQFHQYEKILTNLQTHIGRSYIASGIIGSNGVHLVFDSTEDLLEGETISAYIAESIYTIREVIDKLNLGAMQLFMITTHRYHVFLHSLPKEEIYFLCLIIKKNGNIGLAKLVLEKTASKLRVS